MDRRSFVALVSWAWAAVCAVPSLVVHMSRTEPASDGFTAISWWYGDGHLTTPVKLSRDGRWHHYAAVLHADGSETLYVDGQEVRW